MDSTTKNYSFTASDNILRVPFVVSVRDTAPESIDSLLDAMSDKLGAKYFRSKELFIETLAEKSTAAQDRSKFLNGPFVGVVINAKEVVRLMSFDAPQGGMTVYSIDELKTLMNEIDGPLVVQNAIRRNSLKP